MNTETDPNPTPSNPKRNTQEVVYHDLLKRILYNGVEKENRTGVNTVAVFGHQMRFDLREGFPLLTTKKVWFNAIVHELIWMLSGKTNTDYLKEHGVTIWDENAAADFRPELGYPEGELGPVYGKQWRAWDAPEATHQTPGALLQGADGIVIDQVAEVVRKLREAPTDRRNIVSAWNVGQLHCMKLPPCHLLYQFDVTEGRLSCAVVIRSWDVFLGAPFNIAFYALLTHMLAQVAGLAVGDLVVTSHDTHLYVDHLEQAHLQLTRRPRPFPRLELDPSIEEIDDFSFEHVTLHDYDPHPPIKAKMAR